MAYVCTACHKRAGARVMDRRLDRIDNMEWWDT
jgi:hypothetical protein